jgi:cytoskeletal protein CcmA (bactofilin family)
MFGRSTRQQQSPIGRKGAIPSVIAADMNVLGNIISEGMLDIDGKIDGNVRCHTLNLRENGRIKGDVIAESVHIHGQVEGLVKATHVMLYASARVTGTLMHETLSIEDGAFVDGKLKRTDRIPVEEVLDERAAPLLEGNFVNDNDEPASEAERIVLENLRLIR